VPSIDFVRSEPSAPFVRGARIFARPGDADSTFAVKQLPFFAPQGILLRDRIRSVEQQQ